MQRGFAGIVAILIFAIFFGGLVFAFYKGYLKLNIPKTEPQNPATTNRSPTPQPTLIPAPTPTSDETVDWKTYESNEYSFTFKYPPDWEVRDVLLKNKSLGWLQTTQLYLGIAPKNIQEDHLGSIRVTTDSLITTINEIKNTSLTYYKKRPVSEDIQMERAELVFGDKIKTRYMLYKYNNKTYVLEGGGTEDISIQNKILSTFKFTDQNQVVDTADWKTYTDIMNGYSVKYPNGWILTKSETSVNFTPPGADLFPATQKNTPGALEPPPSISIDVLNKPFNEADSETRSATEQSTITISGVSGNYYTVLGAPFSIINFDLPAHDNKKTIRFTFPVNAENFSTFNTAHEQNIAKFDKETFKTIIQTFKFTQ